MTPEAINAALATTLIGRKVEVHLQVSSTNDLALEAARRGEREGLVVLAEEQIAGRGRLGRVWTAPPGCCILCSVLLRPRFPAQHAFHLTMAASLAIYRAIAGTTEESITDHRSLTTNNSVLTIKWPNDVMLNGRKVCGVLCESEWSGRDWLFSVVGLGINVNVDRRELGDLQWIATSLSAELGHQVDRVELLARVLYELEGLYFLLQSGQFGAVYSAWAEKLETVGRRVSVRGPEGIIEGKAIRVEGDGALILATDDGERRVLAGDVLAL
jgi:BirA family biotin operon repressor/biotin-[acetyl-CoA-carboxylase] ligase